jgi:hypothetical protein
MYGLINMAIKQLVLDNFGESGWQKVLQESQVKLNYFELLTVYDDDLTYKLVHGACKVSGKKPEEILTLFGGYWINYAVSAGYEPLLKLFGPTFKDCLLNLNRMHDHMGAMMPGLIPPEFEIENEVSDHELHLLYTSKRPGLAPMVDGLLVALGKRYGVESLEIKHLGKTEDNKSDRFLVKWK